MSDDISGVQGKQVYFDIKGFGGPGKFHGSVAEMIFAELQKLVKQASSNINGITAETKKLGQLQKSINNMMKEFNDLMALAAKKTPMSQTAANKVGAKLQADMGAAGKIIGSLKDAVIKQQLAQALAGIEKLLSSKAILTDVEKLWKAMQTMKHWVNKLGPDWWPNGSGPTAQQFFGAFAAMEGALGALGIQINQYKKDFKPPPSWLGSLEKVYSNAKNAVTMLGNICLVWSTMNGGVDSGPTLRSIYLAWQSKGSPAAKKAYLDKEGKSWINMMYAQYRTSGSGDNWGGRPWGQAYNNWVAYYGQTQTAVGQAEHTKIPPGDLVQLVYKMLLSGDDADKDFPNIFAEWQDALSDAQQMSNDCNDLSNKSIAQINSILAAMKAEARFMDKEMMQPIRAVDQSLADINKRR